MNDKETARKLYLTIIRLYPTSDYALRALARVGDVYRSDRQYLQAVDFYRKVAANYSRLEREQQERLEEVHVRVRYMIGATYYDQKNYRLAFGELRAFIQHFPDSKYANVAYFLIGQSHLVNKNYRAALGAFEAVGTAQGAGEQARKTVIAPGGPLYIQVRDPDMRTAAQGQMVKIQLKTTRGDMETLLLKPKGIGSDVFVSNIKTRLGSPQPTAPLEGMWSAEVDTEFNRSLKMAAEFAKRVEELEIERETAKAQMVRISKDPDPKGEQKLEAVSKQKELL